MDQEGRVYTDENEARAKIIFKPDQEVDTSSFILKGIDAIAKNGRFVFEAFEARISPGLEAQITIQFSGLEDYGTEIDFIEEFPTFVVSARKCIEGEKYTADLTCEPCPPAFYLFEAQEKPGVCKECHPNAFCYGRNNTAPKP